MVGEIDKADTEKSEKEIADVQAQIKNNEHKIEQGEKRISRYDTMLQDIRGYDPKQFDAEQARQNFKNKLQNTYSEFEDMSPDIDFSESGAEFLSFLVKFVHEKRQATEKSNEVLKAENMKLQRNAGILKAKIDSQRRLA